MTSHVKAVLTQSIVLSVFVLYYSLVSSEMADMEETNRVEVDMPDRAEKNDRQHSGLQQLELDEAQEKIK